MKLLISFLLLLSSISFSQEYKGLYIIESESDTPVMYIGELIQSENLSINHESLHFDTENLHVDDVAHVNNILLMLEQFHFDIEEDKNNTRLYYSFQSDKYHIESRNWRLSLSIKD